VFCGIDWAEAHHDVAIVDPEGRLVARQRISDDAAGFADLVELLATHGDSPTDPIPVAIETSRGLLVACLRTTGRPVFAINPLAVARYRQRHSVARKKSDHGDALVLANILRTDLAAHRPLPADSELVRAIAVLARAQQDAVWDRTLAHNRLRSLLREFYRSILAAVAGKRGGLLRPEARMILAVAATRPRRPGCRWRSCDRCSATPAGAAASTPKRDGSMQSCAPPTCTSHRWWRRRWAARRWRCCASWRPPAPAPRSSLLPPSPSSPPILTPSSSPASRAWER